MGDLAKSKEEELSSVRDNPYLYSQVVDGFMSKINEKAINVEPTGEIAPTGEDSYDIIMNTPDGQKVKNLDCSTGALTGTSLINSKKVGGEAAVFDSIYVTTDGGGGHHGLVHTPKPGSKDYFGNNWGYSAHFQATNMLSATQQANAKTPYLINQGTDTFYSKDGKRYAYNDLSVGDMLPVKYNPANNSMTSLEAPFEMLSQKGMSAENKTYINFGAESAGKIGENPNFGKYKSGTLQLSINENLYFGKGFNLSGDASVGLSNIKTTLNDDKKVDYSIKSKHLGVMLKNDALKLNNNISVTPFVYAAGDTYDISTTGSVKYEDGFKTLNKTLEVNDIRAGVYGGVNYEAGNKNLKVATTGFAGVRYVKNSDIYGKNRLSPETVYGARAGVSGNFDVGGATVGLSGSASQVNVDTPTYDLTNRHVELGQQVSFSGHSLYAKEGFNNQKISFSEYTGIYEKNTPFLQAGYNLQKGPVRVGVAAEKSGGGVSGMATFNLGF